MRFIKKNEGFFYFLLIATMSINYMLESAAISNYQDMLIHDILLIATLGFALVCIFVQKYTLKEMLQIIIINGIGMICYFSSGNTGFLTTMLVVTLMPKNKLDKTLMLIFKIFLIMTIAIVIASLIGILENKTMEISKSFYMASGMTLGFGHANTMAAQMMTLIFLNLAIKRETLSNKLIGISLILIVLVYFISACRTALLLGSFVIFLLFLRKNVKVKKLLFKFLPYLYIFVMVIIFASMAIYCCLGHNNLFVGFVNDTLFNGRVGLAARSLLTYPITLFGTYMDTTIWGKYSYFALDNGQANILISYGIMGFLVYFWLFQKILFHVKIEKNYVFAVLLIYFIIYTLFEGSMYFFGKNFALLFIGTSKKKKEIKSDQRYTLFEHCVRIKNRLDANGGK